MIEKIKHHWEVLKYSAILAFKRECEYSSYLFCWMFMIPIEIFSGFYMLKVIMDRVGELNGWTFGQVAFLYGVGVFSHGFQDLFFIQTRWIESDVLEGGYDRMLVRPLGVFFQFCVGTVNLCGLFSLIPGIIIFTYGCIAVEFQWTLANALMLILVVVGGTMIQAAIYTLTGSVAFWTKKSQVLVGVNLQLFDKTTQWPMTIYPKWFIGIFSFLIPMGFVSFYPACGLLGIDSGIEWPFAGLLTGGAESFPLPLEMAVWTPIVGFLWFLLAMKVFQFGLRAKYESAGS